MSGETCNTWKTLAIKLGFAVVALLSFVAVTFASVTWSRGEGREVRLRCVERDQAVFKEQVKNIADGVKRLEHRFNTHPKADK